MILASVLSSPHLLCRIKLQQAVVSSSFVSLPLPQPSIDVAESQANRGQTSKKKRSKNRKSPDNPLTHNGNNQEDTLDATGKFWEVDSSNLHEAIQVIDPIAHFSSSDVR